MNREFDSLYSRLASAWLDHQRVRQGHPSFSDLAESGARLNRARTDMLDWHRHNPAAMR